MSHLNGSLERSFKKFLVAERLALRRSGEPLSYEKRLQNR